MEGFAAIGLQSISSLSRCAGSRTCIGAILQYCTENPRVQNAGNAADTNMTKERGRRELPYFASLNSALPLLSDVGSGSAMRTASIGDHGIFSFQQTTGLLQLQDIRIVLLGHSFLNCHLWQSSAWAPHIPFDQEQGPRGDSSLAPLQSVLMMRMMRKVAQGGGLERPHEIGTRGLNSRRCITKRSREAGSGEGVSNWLAT